MQRNQLGLSDKAVYAIQLAVDEACTNVIKHAYQYEPNRKIEIIIHPDKDRMQITVVDDGKAFNPSITKLPDLKQHLAHYRRGGLGIYLMRTLMDKVEYNYSPGKKNHVGVENHRSGNIPSDLQQKLFDNCRFARSDFSGKKRKAGPVEQRVFQVAEREAMLGAQIEIPWISGKAERFFTKAIELFVHHDDAWTSTDPWEAKSAARTGG